MVVGWLGDSGLRLPLVAVSESTGSFAMRVEMEQRGERSCLIGVTETGKGNDVLTNATTGVTTDVLSLSLEQRVRGKWYADVRQTLAELASERDPGRR